MIQIFQSLFGAALMLASFYHATSQNSRQPILHNGIAAPTGLAVGSFINSVTQEKVIAGWIPSKGARTYTIRLYTREDDVLQREITNIKVPVIILEDLDSGTKYSITVSAVYENANDILVESVESNALEFDTREECMGGQIWTECDGACIARCNDPDPVCSRQCQPGCNCPLEANVWDGTTCIVAELCPTERGIPVKVENLHVVDSTSSYTVLGWNINLGAFNYEITVRLAENRSVIVQTQTSNVPVIRLTGLNPGVVYSFGVIAFVRTVQTVQSRSALLPPRFRIVSVEETSFTVTWSKNRDSIRYAFVLYDESRQNILYENERIGGTSVKIEQLAPGTIYYFSIAAAGPNEDIGIFSPRTLIRTLGPRSNVNPLEVVIDHMIELPATTMRPNVFTNVTVTHCLQEYQGVELFYQQFSNAATNGPRYPNCQDNGLYVPTLCEINDPDACYCIREDNGTKRKGSDFGGTNSHFPLDCARYGDLDEDLNLRLGKIRSTSIEVIWDTAEQAQSYIVYVQNVDQPSDEKTIAVNAALNEYTLENLIPGSAYEIGIYIVNSNGSASSLISMETTTALVDKPERLRILSKISTNLTVRWRVDATAEGYAVRLKLKESDIVVEELDYIIQDHVTFTNLTMLKKYIVEIRAVGFQYDARSNAESSQFSEPASIEVLVICDLSSLDIIFAMESSGPSQWHELQAMKGLAANLMAALPPIQSTNGTRVATLRFNQNANYIFNYERFKFTPNSIGALRYIRYLGGHAPQVGRMMSSLTSRYFTNPANNAYRRRHNALSVVMIFTSGRTRGSLTSAPLSYANQARRLQQYTNVFTIGVTNWSNPSVLRKIASTPNSNIMFPSFEELESSVNVVLERLCLIS